MLEQLIKDNIIPDMLTDQTSAHDPLNGYVPNGLSLDAGIGIAQKRPGRI